MNSHEKKVECNENSERYRLYNDPNFTFSSKKLLDEQVLKAREYIFTGKVIKNSIITLKLN